MKRKLCPVCSKKLRYNFVTKEYHCPIEKINAEKRLGCGYIWKPHVPPKNTDGDKKKIMKALGGR